MKSIFRFDTTYFELPENFYSKIQFRGVPQPEWVLHNYSLAKDLNISTEFTEDLLQILVGNQLDKNSIPFAQAYAGHQFGHFTMLGDGRATMLGEHLDGKGNRWDIQLKGSGRTVFSRRGDGKATLRSMLREYLFSEAMHHLNIPTSRSLAVIKTGEEVYREEIHQGAILTRVMKSHIRVGTFEFARYFGGIDEVEALLNYTIKRLYPELKNAENPALELLKTVMHGQIDLVVEWLRVGFIHGVMNTDNTSISCETFDYGPCAFLGNYHPGTVFSSIDTEGRYAFENQPKILQWNLARLGDTLLPLIDSDENKAVKLATTLIESFAQIYFQKWYEMMFRKIGIEEEQEGDAALVEELLDLMFSYQKDFTHTFTYLREPHWFEGTEFQLGKEFDSWISRWKERIQDSPNWKNLMQKNNPVVTPRNYFVELALENAENDNWEIFHEFLKVLQQPYEFSEKVKNFWFSPPHFDRGYVTFCNT